VFGLYEEAVINPDRARRPPLLLSKESVGETLGQVMIGIFLLTFLFSRDFL